MNGRSIRYSAYVALFCGAAVFAPGGRLAFGAEIRGSVVEGDRPISGALARVRGTNIIAITDQNGIFTLADVPGSDSVMVSAWKEEFYINGSSAFPGDLNVEISLKRYLNWDHKLYEWLSPGPPSPSETRCMNCHSGTIIPQWKGNLHSLSAVDPIVLAMYTGTDLRGNANVEPGYKLDVPGEGFFPGDGYQEISEGRLVGDCASCHAPTAELAAREDPETGTVFFDAQPHEDEACGNCHDTPWWQDLSEVSGVHQQGVFCDFCHKIIDVNDKAARDGSNAGILSITLRRPAPGNQLFIGSFNDVPGEDAYLPLYRTSRFCAPCHQLLNNGIPIYSSYPEWLASSYAERGVQCQDCHMAPDGVTTNLAPAGGGIERDPMTIPSHLQMGADDSLFIAETAAFKVEPVVKGDTLLVQVSITNVTGGHHFPTGSPLRNMVLVVDALDASGNQLAYAGELRVPDWGGVGSAPDDFGGLPGKGFAKILEDDKGNYPAPQWRKVVIRSDTRIPANATDVSSYPFVMASGSEHLVVRAKLVYRKVFKPWADAKKMDLKDYVVGEDVMTLVKGTAFLRGDFNQDGQVDFQDFLAFAQGFTSKRGEENYDAGMDMDSDGEIGFGDFLKFSADFGKRSISGKPVGRVVPVLPDA